MAEEIYIGTKVIAAEEMDERTFNEKVKNLPWPAGGDNRSGYKVRYEGGYVSWSPKETRRGRTGKFWIRR